MKIHKHFMLFTLGLFFLSLLYAQSTALASQGYLGAQPSYYDESNPKTRSWFIYELKPGESKEDSINVVNTSDNTIDVKIYPVDATTTQDGAFALLNENQKQNEIGKWVKLEKDIISIKPFGSQKVPFTITIPEHTTVGDHPGGIIVQEIKKQDTAAKGIGLNIVSRIGTRIYETVPGDKIYKMDLHDFTHKIADDHLTYAFTLENTGNVILNPTGRIELKDQSGKIIDTIPLNFLGSVFPGKPTKNTAVSKNTAPQFGQFTATIIVNYSTTKALSKSISFFLFIKNWEYLIPAPVIIILITLFIAFRKRIAKHFRHVPGKITPRPSVPPPPGAPFIPVPAISAKPALSVAPAQIQNIDQLFIARHIKFILFLIPSSIIILSGLFAFLFYYFALSGATMIAPLTGQNPGTQNLSPVQLSPQPVIEPSLAPTDVPVDKSKMEIDVLNGSGIPGAAKSIADKLTVKGFSVFKIGNALEETTQTTIQYPPAEKDGARQLESVLKPDYTNIKLLESENSSRFIIILVN